MLPTLDHYIGEMNERQRLAYQSKVSREQQKPFDQRREVRLNIFELPSSKKPFIDYHVSGERGFIYQSRLYAPRRKISQVSQDETSIECGEARWDVRNV